MILVDTSVWIQYFRANPAVHPIILAKYRSGEIITTGCVLAELLQGVRNSGEARLIDAHWEALPRLPEDKIWAKAGRLSFEGGWIRKGVGVVDAFLVAFAREYRCSLWTLDKKLKSVLKDGEVYEP